jgi:uncharacterized protein with FMN-binding domain
MRRAPIVLAATAMGTAAIVAFHPKHLPATVVAGGSAATGGSTASAAGRSTTSAGGASTSTRPSAPSARSVTGAAETTPYGPVQVRITVRSGKVVEVTPVQLPQNDGRSLQINAYAAPLLRQEALTAQSAQIDAISGATFTSAGFQASLQSALTQAHV